MSPLVCTFNLRKWVVLPDLFNVLLMLKIFLGAPSSHNLSLKCFVNMMGV